MSQGLTVGRCRGHGGRRVEVLGSGYLTATKTTQRNGRLYEANINKITQLKLSGFLLRENGRGSRVHESKQIGDV